MASSKRFFRAHEPCQKGRRQWSRKRNDLHLMLASRFLKIVFLISSELQTLLTRTSRVHRVVVFRFATANPCPAHTVAQWAAFQATSRIHFLPKNAFVKGMVGPRLTFRQGAQVSVENQTKL